MTHRSVFAVVAALATALLSPVSTVAQQPASVVAVPADAAVANPLAEAIRERIDHLSRASGPCIAWRTRPPRRNLRAASST